MNFKAIILISILIMSGISSVNSKHGPDYVSGFLGSDNCLWPEWIFTQYDSNGKTLRNSGWMIVHQEVEVKNVPGNVIKYKYREMDQQIVPVFKTLIKIDFYNYHGGELRIEPNKEARWFLIYYQNKFVAVFEKDKGKSVHRLDLP